MNGDRASALGPLLLTDGAGKAVTDGRSRVRQLVEMSAAPLAAEAEWPGKYPREAIAVLAASGLHELSASKPTLRLRVADVTARTAMARRALQALAAEPVSGAPISLAAVAGMKATVARLAESVVSECMHVFGGAGYLEDENPALARLWWEPRVGRLGGGTDEVMQAPVVIGMRAEPELYRRWVRDPVGASGEAG